MSDGLGNESHATTDPNAAPPVTTTPPVPNLDIYQTGETILFLIMPADQTYRLTVQSGLDPVRIEARRGTGSATTEAVRYHDLELPANTRAQFVVDQQKLGLLNTDADGDGTFETLLTLDAALIGAAAQDTDAPIVTFVSSGPLASTNVVLNASDSGSGVRQLLYSLDGVTFLPYRDPNPGGRRTIPGCVCRCR